MAELSKYQKQLSKEGVCVLTNIIPEDLLFLLSTYFQKREFEKRLILQDTASEFTLKEGPANDKLTAFFNQKKFIIFSQILLAKKFAILLSDFIIIRLKQFPWVGILILEKTIPKLIELPL